MPVSVGEIGDQNMLRSKKSAVIGDGQNGELLNEEVLRFEDVVKIYKSGPIVNYALDKVNFTLKNGETIAIVGESGSGKTTLGMAAINLLEHSKGTIYFLGNPLKKLRGRKLKDFRAKSQMIFQDPYGSLNPYNSVFDSVVAPLNNFRPDMSKTEKREAVLSMLDRVGLRPAESFIDEFPKKLSGGQRQRVSIARALIMRPALIIADEPTSMLDVSVSSTVITLLNELKKEMHFSMLYISHELATAKYISERMAVMNLGRIVEIGNSDEIVAHPSHPYTKLLLTSMPDVKNKPEDEMSVNLNFDEYNGGIKGCTFASVCPFVKENCKETRPELTKVDEGHYVACFYPL